jgi:hypothetical protein
MHNTKIAPIKLFRMTYQTDSTEGEVAALGILPAPADTANTGFCLDYQEKKASHDNQEIPW